MTLACKIENCADQIDSRQIGVHRFNQSWIYDFIMSHAMSCLARASCRLQSVLVLTPTHAQLDDGSAERLLAVERFTVNQLRHSAPLQGPRILRDGPGSTRTLVTSASAKPPGFKCFQQDQAGHTSIARAITPCRSAQRFAWVGAADSSGRAADGS
jgi:hypothetical protein